MSEKKTDAWMPLWIGAYLADTMRLTTLQHGAYFLMLLAYWRDGEALPDDDEDLRSITKTEKAEWKKLRPVMANFFVVGNGVWWHKRVESELASSKQRAEKSVERAKAAAQTRWKGKKTDNKPMLEDMLKHEPSMQSDDACAYPQALLEDVQKPCLSNALHNTSHTIGIHTDVVNTKTSVCVPSPHTQISDEFREVIKTERPELDADLVFTNFADHYTPEKRTLARWRQWVKNEFVPLGVVAQPAPVQDAAELTQKRMAQSNAGVGPPPDDVRQKLAEITAKMRSGAASKVAA
jgi:uncharacterized protein YdaU (DUF1376 family)